MKFVKDLSFLNERELQRMVQDGQFGNLIRYAYDYLNSNQLLWFLMSRQVVDCGIEFWMVIHKRPLWFSLLEYGLITWLNYSSTYPAILEEDGFRRSHFPGMSTVTLVDLRARIVEFEGEIGVEVDVEKIKLASLYFASVILSHRRKRNKEEVDPQWKRRSGSKIRSSTVWKPPPQYWPTKFIMVVVRLFQLVERMQRLTAPNDVCGMLTPTDAELLSAHYISGDFIVSNECLVTRRMSELMSRGLKSTSAQFTSHQFTSAQYTSHHASPSHLQSLEERLTGVEVQLTMMWQQQANIMDILKSHQSDMLIVKSIVEDKRARSPVITTGGMTASAEMTERAEETDSPDGFELALSMLPPVREVTWTGLLEVAGWTKVARMVLLSPVREEESGST
ncbi:hypothetical protein F511_29426 [Dorcoceras hygrometricum]|uniref:Uncharacterized protein n=1 Tax=Dorcoceras hygrometricum TaxID=472368 RepID=A0A2Z7BE02_9LAMI|nr:hypothetical protein F511_29426 [Dorcoceras hygrometricum]